MWFGCNIFFGRRGRPFAYYTGRARRGCSYWPRYDDLVKSEKMGEKGEISLKIVENFIKNGFFLFCLLVIPGRMEAGSQ